MTICLHSYIHSVHASVDLEHHYVYTELANSNVIKQVCAIGSILGNQ